MDKGSNVVTMDFINFPSDNLMDLRATALGGWSENALSTISSGLSVSCLIYMLWTGERLIIPFLHLFTFGTLFLFTNIAPASTWIRLNIKIQFIVIKIACEFVVGIKDIASYDHINICNYVHHTVRTHHEHAVVLVVVMLPSTCVGLTLNWAFLNHHNTDMTSDIPVLSIILTSLKELDTFISNLYGKCIYGKWFFRASEVRIIDAEFSLRLWHLLKTHCSLF